MMMMMMCISKILFSFRIVWGPGAGDRAPLENAITFGDTITVTVSKITGYTGVVSEPMKVDIKFLLNGKMVYYTMNWVQIIATKCHLLCLLKPLCS